MDASNDSSSKDAYFAEMEVLPSKKRVARPGKRV